MKKSILFIGRDDTLRREFKAYAASEDSAWTPQFALTGTDATAQCDQREFAAIVSDAELPDTSGLELLDNLMRLQPKALRIIMSNPEDAQATVQCIGRAHHHLCKPCDLQMLMNALNQAVERETWLPSSTVMGMIGKMKKVPSPPMIYFQVATEIQSPNASISKISELISQDPALTAKILQLANSAVFGLQLQVVEPIEAISYIGMETTKALVLLAHTFSTFDALHVAGFSVETLWSHCVLAGAFARRIAALETTDAELTEQAFAAGLLHDFGKLLIGANMPERFIQVLDQARADNCSFADAERKLFPQAGHAELGACMLGIWWLPQPIVEAVAFHHCPTGLANPDFSPLTAAHAGNVLAHEVIPGRPGTVYNVVDTEYLKYIGREDRWKTWRRHCLTSAERIAA